MDLIDWVTLLYGAGGSALFAAFAMLFRLGVKHNSKNIQKKNTSIAHLSNLLSSSEVEEHNKKIIIIAVKNESDFQRTYFTAYLTILFFIMTILLIYQSSLAVTSNSVNIFLIIAPIIFAIFIFYRAFMCLSKAVALSSIIKEKAEENLSTKFSIWW